MASVNANGIRIEYETFGDPSSPALLLIIGLGCQLIHWQDEFCRQIADSGYHVIRYDNRDKGLSTKIEGLTADEIMEKTLALFMGQDVPVPYTLEDMADDAVGLLDALHIEKAHICGMSMGGMIAQTVALNNPDRALSLTSIYSSPGTSDKYAPTPEMAEALMQPEPLEREANIDYMVSFFKLTYGTGLEFDEAFHRSIAARAYDRSFCPEGSGRQLLAIMTQKDREAALKELNVPALVIHGDADPLVPLEAGRATANAIPGAELMVIEGMGHSLPNLNAYWDRIADAMVRHMADANT
ncbi:MAG: alpha/beta fold hydrolase [Deltaproteobacteria bacterium]|nr:alpha/beta fold hydrolase [Deltaproteobacteria bacterium]